MSKTYLILIFLVLLLTVSLKRSGVKLNGDWKIEFLIVENDTLYQSENITTTVRFYNKKMSGWTKTEEDADYISKCLRSTYIDLKGVTLSINRKNYSRTPIIACWDNIQLPSVVKGSYKSNDDTLYLFDSNQKLDMQLTYNNANDFVSYINSEYNYKIVFKRIE
jgi:hypothetical protein